MRIKNLPTSIATSVIITLIFSPAIIYPFFQDDFFALVTTRISSLAGVMNLFRLIPEAVYWRPLGIQLYFGLMQFLGPGQPIWFHLVSLGVHLLNTYLVYRLVLAVGKNDRVAKLTAFLWGTSPIHYFALGWAVNFSFILVVTWSILAILAAGEGKGFRTILFLILGLMTNEIAVVIPGLLILVSGRQKLKLIVSMSAIVAAYLIWRLASGVKIEGDYELGLAAAASTLRWYGLWILGWSDIIRDFIRWGVVFRPEFFKTFPAVVSIYLTEAGVLVWLVRGGWRRRSSVMCFSWILIGLMPVLFFQKHLYSHYGAIASIGFYWWLAEIAVARRREMMMAVVWIMVAFTTMGLNYRASWMADHARNSIDYQSKIRQSALYAESASRIYIVSGDLKVETVLLGGYGAEYLTGINRDSVIFVNPRDGVPEQTPDTAVIFL